MASTQNAGNGNNAPPLEEEPTETERRLVTVSKLCGSMTTTIARALPESAAIKAEKFAQLCMTVFRTELSTNKDENNALIWCSDHSLMRVMVQAAEVGLQPGSSLGLGHFIAYAGSAQFQIGVWGWVELLNRTGQYARIDTDVVYENDVIKITRGQHPDLVHEIDPRKTRVQRGKPLGAYACSLMTNGTQAFVWETEEDLEMAKSMSKAPNSIGYTKFPDEMRQRTVLKRAAKKWPKGIEAARGVDLEESGELRADLQDMLSDLEARITGNGTKPVPVTKQGQALDDIMGKRPAALGMGGVQSNVTTNASGSEVTVGK